MNKSHSSYISWFLVEVWVPYFTSVNMALRVTDGGHSLKEVLIYIDQINLRV